jgi:hypothetical protein
MSLATGDRARDLGMGHTMLTPNAWFELTRRPLRVAGSLAYSHALGGDSHHVHGGPIVEPMTASEFALELRAGAPLLAALGVEARTLLELPTSDAPARGLVGLGVQVPFAGGSSLIEAAMPVLGDAFDWRLTSGVRFEF